jgi:hypothetical protein
VPEKGPWLVSARWDVAVFGGSAALAFALLAVGKATGALLGDTPTWAWIGAVVFVDVAHVWATAYRVYFDPEELRRRTGLYLAVPLAAYVGGVLLYTAGAQAFWRVLAYVAVIHFVRQQYGWVALYRRRLGTTSTMDRILDDAAIYSATLYPLLYWHANLPREFAWFLPGDFLPGLPKQAATWLFPVHIAITAAYVLRQAQRKLRKQPISHGKNLIVATTWASWYTGIVVFDSDYAFTVTNVLVHGLPYLAFVWVYERARWQGSTATIARLFRPNRWPVYVAPLLLFAWLEEWGWDRIVWHERAFLFPGADLVLQRGALALIVPLLALPQATHYLLDAWIWRVRPENPELVRWVG